VASICYDFVKGLCQRGAECRCAAALWPRHALRSPPACLCLLVPPRPPTLVPIRDRAIALSSRCCDL
jgi:hypothetical protein